MKKYLLLILAIVLITACKSEKKVIELEETKLEAFSDSVLLDTFKVILKGEESKQMKILFTIVSHNGKQIYKEEIIAQDLLKSYLASEDLKKESEKIKFLTDEIKFFLDDEHFLVPAITDQEKADKNTPDIAFYNELKQSQLNGFGYRLGKDVKIYIGWSIKDQKVKIYYKCC